MNTEPKPIYGDGNPETHPLTWRLSKQDAVRNADEYEALEGYAGFKKALSMPPKDVLDVIKAATVKGRGGAGFPAGIKWSLMAPNDGGPRYLICNADEMEPGTFNFSVKYTADTANTLLPIYGQYLSLPRAYTYFITGSNSKPIYIRTVY